MTPYQQKYLPYAIFFSTLLVGTVTLLTATQLRKPTEEQSVAPQASRAGMNGSIYIPSDVSCSDDNYKLDLKVTANGNPNYPVFTTAGASNTHDTKEFSTSYTISIDSYQAKANGEWYDVPRTQCILKSFDSRVIVSKEGSKELAVEDPEGDLAEGEKVKMGDGEEYTVVKISLNDLKTSRKCGANEEGSELLKAKGVETRYNGVKLLWEDYRNLCEGNSSSQYYSGESCPNGDKACCWNPSTSNHEISHERVWLQVAADKNSLGDKEKITSTYTTPFKELSEGKYCGTIQHDTLVPAFLPHDGDEDVDCNGEKNGSLPAFYGLSQTGYSCETTENKSPVCQSVQRSPEQNAVANPDGSYPSATKWTFVCTGSDADTGDTITGFEYQILNPTSNAVIQQMQCIAGSADPAPKVGSAVCTYNGNAGSLQGYVFASQGDFKVKCKVRDSKGAWSSN